MLHRCQVLKAFRQVHWEALVMRSILLTTCPRQRLYPAALRRAAFDTDKAALVREQRAEPN